MISAGRALGSIALRCGLIGEEEVRRGSGKGGGDGEEGIGRRGGRGEEGWGGRGRRRRERKGGGVRKS